MPFSSDHDSPRQANSRKTDPFASLPAPRARRRFWLFELFMAPFQDHDERATYKAEAKATQAEDANGVRVSKAWNGNGVPTANGHGRPMNGNGTAGIPAGGAMAQANGSGPALNGHAASGRAGVSGYAVTGAASRYNGNGNSNPTANAGGLFSSVDRQRVDH